MIRMINGRAMNTAFVGIENYHITTLIQKVKEYTQNASILVDDLAEQTRDLYINGDYQQQCDKVVMMIKQCDVYHSIDH